MGSGTGKYKEVLTPGRRKAELRWPLFSRFSQQENQFALAEAINPLDPNNPFSLVPEVKGFGCPGGPEGASELRPLTFVILLDGELVTPEG
jgi:hypothetical protein